MAEFIKQECLNNIGDASSLIRATIGEKRGGGEGKTPPPTKLNPEPPLVGKGGGGGRKTSPNPHPEPLSVRGGEGGKGGEGNPPTLKVES